MTSTMLLVITILLVATLTPPASTNLHRPFEWNVLNFQWPALQDRSAAPVNMSFVQENNLPLGLEVWNDKLFLTIPRRKPGVPATLTYLKLNDSILGTTSSPQLLPYPDWETNRLEKGPKEMPRITSTYRVKADECDRLWVVDSGLAADQESGVFGMVTPPQILIYDLRTDLLLRRYYLKDEDFRTNSFMANIAVDVFPYACDDAFAYLPDLGSYAMVVYSLLQNDSWRVEHNYFFLDPLEGNFDFGDLRFQWNDGVFAVALSGPDSCDFGYRKLFFHPLVSTNEFMVSTRVLRNRTLASHSYLDFSLIGSRGERGQSTASYMDERTGVLFMLEVQNHRVTCWDASSGQPMNNQTLGIVVGDDGYSFIYPSDVKVDRDGNLWFITNNLPIFVYSDVDTNSVNYFIYRIPVDDAIRGTPCEKRARSSFVNI